MIRVTLKLLDTCARLGVPFAEGFVTTAACNVLSVEVRGDTGHTIHVAMCAPDYLLHGLLYFTYKVTRNTLSHLL